MESNMPKYPDIKVYLTNRDGNAFAILARCKNALVLVGKEDKWTEFLTEATSADYTHLIITVMKWFEVE